MSEKILIYGLNWLGDSIMSMPAVTAACRSRPDAHVTVLAKHDMAEIWALDPTVDAVEIRDPSEGAWRTGRRLRKGGFAHCYVLPNSFRSAWIPFLARIPHRTGFRGQYRAALLTEIVRAGRLGIRHQAEEYFDLFGLHPGDSVSARLDIPAPLAGEARHRLGLGPDETGLAVMPGAARGPAKRWDAARFAQAARSVAESKDLRVVVLGAAADREACAAVAAAIGSRAVNLAGETTLPLLAAVLAASRVALTNDSGGMHLAAAVGTPVVAVFGLTDPRLTGPMGAGHVVVRAVTEGTTRDVRRNSARARAALDAVQPDQVIEAVNKVLEQTA